jgi:hypothetical protein
MRSLPSRVKIERYMHCGSHVLQCRYMYCRCLYMCEYVDCDETFRTIVTLTAKYVGLTYLIRKPAVLKY